jgi:hypothetical protein
MINPWQLRLAGVAGLTAVLTAPILGAGAAAAASAGQPITVTNTNDSGTGSLRSAIDSANATAGPDTIAFRLTMTHSKPFTITPLTALPAITDPITIDGYTVVGSTRPTATRPAVLGVVIDASNVAVGLDVRTDDSLITGIVVNGAYSTTDGPVDIRIVGNRNRVTASHVGTDVTGRTRVSTWGCGISIVGTGNTIGGTSAERNVIAHYWGVFIGAGKGNAVTGNLIGTNADGTKSIGGAAGVRIAESNGNTVRRNLISGWATGIYVSGDQNVFRSNLIGTDITGRNELGNGEGIFVAGGKLNRIGGPGSGEGNVLSGNDWFGILLEHEFVDDPADGNVIQGNMIGVDITGTVAMPNGGEIAGLGEGIMISWGNDNVVGGSEPGAANVISGNIGDGIEISALSSGNRVLRNRIGTDLTGTLDLGNTESGVHILGSGNEVGDPDDPSGLNVISHNGQDGVEIEGKVATGNSILRNSILLNDGLGIDLGTDGRNIDDPAPDSDTGPNDLQNAPVPTTAVRTPTSVEVTWTLDSLASTRMRLEFYWSSGCDPTGFGEGLLYLGSTTVTTDTAGGAGTTAVLPSWLPASSVVTATATPLIGLGTPTSTSEFSECMVVP